MGILWFALFMASVACVAHIVGEGTIRHSASGNVLDEIADESWNEMKVRQYFSNICQQRLNEQIGHEFMASHVYLSMSSYLDRWDVALPGFAKKFRTMSDEEREHGMKIIQYINKRGGVARIPYTIDVSEYRQEIENNDWHDIMNVTQTALKLERYVNHKLVEYVRTCSDKHNFHMENFIDEYFLTEQVDSIHELGRIITELKMIGASRVDNYGLYEYDKKLLK